MVSRKNQVLVLRVALCQTTTDVLSTIAAREEKLGSVPARYCPVNADPSRCVAHLSGTKMTHRSIPTIAANALLEGLDMFYSLQLLPC